ncbi:ankyrin repeat-containing domain protein [Aspergillus floccosus]
MAPSKSGANFSMRIYTPTKRRMAYLMGIPYEALSYTWGSMIKSDTILIDGKMSEVTSNLYIAMQYLRFKDRDRVMWIDALCIDQGNAEERGHQVLHMPEIYKQAERVIIWLGGATDETNLIMDAMRQLQEVSLRHAFNSQTELKGLLLDLWSSIQPNWEDGSLRARQREGLEALLERAWFRRVWTLQEVAHARAATVVCGTRSISAPIFTHVPSFLEIEPNQRCQAVLDIMPGSSRKTSWWAQKRDLSTLLMKFGQCEATDPRDQIFALLSMSSDAQYVIQPDYTKTIEEAISAVVSFLLSFHELDDAVYRLPRWTLADLLGNLTTLSNSVLRWALGTEEEETVITHLIRRNDINASMRDEERHTPLSWALERGCVEIVKLLVEKDDSYIHDHDEDGKGLLSRAAQKGHRKLVQYLLTQTGVNIDAEDKRAKTALTLAASEGHDEVVQLLLDHPLISHSKPRSGIRDLFRWVPSTERLIESFMPSPAKAALCSAAGRGHEKVVMTLMNHNKMKSHLDDATLMKALAWAVQAGHEEVVKLLIKHAGVNLKAGDFFGFRPLTKAARAGHEGVVKLVLLMNMCVGNEKPTWRYQRSALLSRNMRWITAKLLRNRVRSSPEDARGQTALSIAVDGGHEWLITFIMDYNEKNLILKDAGASAALVWAAKEGHEAMVNRLVKYDGIDFDSRGKEGRTALSWAAQRGDEALVKLLLSQGAGIDVKDGSDRTPLSRAVENGHGSLVRFFLQNATDIESKDYYGHSLLSWAAFQGHEIETKLLLENGADTESKDGIYGRTPLLWAVRNGHMAVVRLLLQEKAKTAVTDSFGHTPLSLSIEKGHPPIVRLLHQAELDG